MKIQLRSINTPSDLKTTALRDRASVSSKCAFTKHYAVICDKREIAFVSLDLPVHKNYLCIYELLVAPSCRSLGYGAAIIQKCKEYAVEEGFNKICLRPWPIDSDGSEEKLRNWYSKQGFLQSSKENGLMEITFTDPADQPDA